MDLLKFILSHRTWWLYLAPFAVLLWFLSADPSGGNQLLTQMQTFMSPFIALTFAYLGRKALMRGNLQDAWQSARRGSVSNGILVLAGAILMACLFLGFSFRAMAGDLPNQAARDLPILKAEIQKNWPTLSRPSILAAQVEQESRWRQYAELKTKREYGFGYSQATIAYNARGVVRFDTMAELRTKYRGLAGWSWADRFNPTYQLRAVTLKNKATFNKMRPLVTYESTAFALMDAAYNCGEGCVYTRRRLCQQIEGCNPDRWFGHLEKFSGQSKTKWAGYGKSAHEITVGHVHNVLLVLRNKYRPFFNES